jgi:hypothetical protein
VAIVGAHCRAVAVVGGCSDSGSDDASERATSTTGTVEREATTSTVAVPVTVVLGHCDIEAVTLRDQEWLPLGVRFGMGGGQPANFTGEGTFVVVSETEGRFEDRGGLVVPFRLNDDNTPWPPGECR